VVCRRCGAVLSEGEPGAVEQLVVCGRCDRDTRPAQQREYFPAVPQEPRRSIEEQTFLAYLRGLGLEALPVILLVPTALLWAVSARAVLA
jgi:hypothetical protein